MSNQLSFSGEGKMQKSKLQLRYEKLIKDIEIKKMQNELFEKAIRECLPKIQNEIEPLEKEIQNLIIDRVIRLDEVFQEIKISKLKKNVFEDYMHDELLAIKENGNEKLKALKEKYIKNDYLEGDYDDFDLQMYANLIKKETGFDADKEALKQKGFERYMEELEIDFDYTPPPKKKSKKQQAKIDQQKEEEKILALDAKTIYFRLIKKYHPDRQQDKAKQKSYTEITKLVTKAYQENDFMGLLKLQIEYLDENDLDASTLADDMLTRYNRILQEQLNELNNRLEDAKYHSGPIFKRFLDRNFNFSEKLLEKEKSSLVMMSKELSNDLEFSYVQKKAWFKNCLVEMEDYMAEKTIQSMFALFN